MPLKRLKLSSTNSWKICFSSSVMGRVMEPMPLSRWLAIESSSAPDFLHQFRKVVMRDDDADRAGPSGRLGVDGVGVRPTAIETYPPLAARLPMLTTSGMLFLLGEFLQMMVNVVAAADGSPASQPG